MKNKQTHWKHLLILIVPALLTLGCSSSEKIKVGFLQNGQDEHSSETEAALEFLKSLEDYEVVVLPLNKLKKRDLDQIDQLWYHRADTVAVSDLEKEMGQIITSYVSEGGDLLLTLDAVHLLNTWNIEPTPITTQYAEIKDEGFGRKLGFHGFRNHPVFKGMRGGAYIWHAKEDHKARKSGFFEGDIPTGPGSGVIGIDWAYINFKEDSKLVWKYDLGSGDILAVGAYTYFSRPNFNRSHLHKFLKNSLDHLEKETDGYYWTYEIENPVKTELDNGKKIEVSEMNSSSWKLDFPQLQLSRKPAGDNYWDLPGTRLLLMGKEKAGFDELWAHPFMAFRDYYTEVKFPGSAEEPVALQSMTPSIKFSPGVVLRTYSIGSETLREITTVSVDGTAMVLHYEWSGTEPLEVHLGLTSNLRFMWPYSAKATGTIGYQWSEDLNALLVTDMKTRTMNAMVGFSEIPSNKIVGKFKSFSEQHRMSSPLETEKNQIAAGFEFLVAQEKPLKIILAAGETNMEDLIEVYRTTLQDPRSILDSTMSYYNALDRKVLQLNTPDSIFNEGFRWAMAGADQFMVETPGVGKSLVAGYGTTASGWGGGHEISGRPGYAWYFGRDAEWSGFALDAYGDYESVKEILKTFNTYQDISGKIFHELTTSGSVHYDASDSTPLYVLLASHYLRASGDLDFIRDTWPNIEKAMAYCYSTDTDGDGLIENTNVGHGWIEGGALFGAHTTFYLAGVWAAALREAAYMARQVGRTEKADLFYKDYQKVRESVNHEFWNQEKEIFNYGLLRDGTYNQESTILPAVPVYFDVISEERAVQNTSKFASRKFSTDWGVRILEETSPYFNPGGYHVGSVWPLFTGWSALAEYHTGKYLQGFSHTMNNLMIYKHWDLGSIEEVLNGVSYKPSGVTHNQGWSQTMVLQPILEGMLGLRPDALNHGLALAPRLPWDWEFFSVENIRFGDHLIDMKMNRSMGKTYYSFSHQGSNPVTVDFNPAFPLGTSITSVTADDQEIPYRVSQNPGGVILLLEDLQLKSEKKLEISHSMGFGALPQVTAPVPGDGSTGMRILGQEIRGEEYIVRLEGLPGRDYVLEVFGPSKPQQIEGAEYLESEGSVYRMQVSFQESAGDFIEKTVTMKF